MKKTVIAVVVGLVIVGLIIAFGQIFTVRYINVEFENAVSATSKEEILSIADIDTHTNIFVMDEKALAKKIENAFEDNVVSVDNIVRHFPNTVTINVSERIALFKIPARVGGKTGYVSVDKNFQRTEIYQEDALQDEVLIDIRGVEITSSYNIDECIALKNIADTLLTIGFKEESIPYLIRTIEFTGDDMTVVLRTDGAILKISGYRDNLKDKFAQVFAQYINESPSLRAQKVFSL